ncbi:MAG: SpoIIE family protein phosphatase, partial [Planctomycetota bacterium]
GVIDSSQYPGRTIETNKDDIFLLYTDAFIESVDQKGNMLGIAGLLRLLNEQQNLAPQEVIPYLSSRLTELDKNNLKDDDATIILGAFTSTRVRLRDNIFAPIRLTRSARDQTRIS